MGRKNRPRKARIFTEQEVMERLAPHVSFLTSLPHAAVERYTKEIAPAFAARWPTARASVIHAFMIEAMTARYGADMINVGGRWLWRASSDLIVQFKLLDDTGLPRNYPTLRAQQFDAQLELDDMPVAMRVTLGYDLDEETSEVVQVRVVGQVGRRLLFSRELVAVQTVIPLFAPPADPAQPTPRRLRARQDENASTRKEDENASTGTEDTGDGSEGL